MNRDATLRAGFVAVLLAVIFYANIPSTLFTIFVIGIIPGTSITIPAWLMLIMYPSLFAVMLYWLGKQSLMIGERKSLKKSTETIKKSAPTALRKSRRRKTTLVTKRRARAAV